MGIFRSIQVWIRKVKGIFVQLHTLINIKPLHGHNKYTVNFSIYSSIFYDVSYSIFLQSIHCYWNMATKKKEYYYKHESIKKKSKIKVWNLVSIMTLFKFKYCLPVIETLYVNSFRRILIVQYTLCWLTFINLDCSVGYLSCSSWVF